MTTDDNCYPRYIVTTALAAAFNLLLVIVVCFVLVPLVRDETNSTREAALEIKELMVESIHNAKELEARLERMSKKDIEDQRVAVELHQRTHDLLRAVLKKLEGEE